MVAVLMQMGVPILCGALWRIIRPDGLDADLTRAVLATLVFNFLLPALVLSVLWSAPLGWQTLKISLYGAALILVGAALTWLVGRLGAVDRSRLGAAILGVAFANVTFLGLPVLEHTFGPWARAIAIQIDLFAGMPLALTFGVLVAKHYGAPPAGGRGPFRALLANPPLWAAGTALALNLGGIDKPPWAERLLGSLSEAAIPLMLVALGLGLRWQRGARRPWGLLAAVLILKLGLVPLFGLWLAGILGFRGETLAALVLEAAMPSMVLGVVFCDRYRLDTPFYALAVTLTTLAALVTLPFWHQRALT
ncbi:AEC family transporter [Candidatus Methylocalor cossyra]|uniref:Transporter n=1 Tax=Candidatus Methylocalor cossyra TaxID=3108543 RepID=A0ABM9NGC0_9GAMM